MTNLMLAALTDDQLLAEARRLAADERRATADVVRVLMELDGRQLYLGEGCASLFTYCTRVLRLAEGAAYNRIEVARAARKYPTLLAELQEGNLNLTTIRLLAPHLTSGNHGDVIAAARGLGKRQVEELVATLRPRRDVPTSIRRLPAAQPGVAPVAPLSTSAAAADPAQEMLRPPSSVLPPPSPGLVSRSQTFLTPLAPERYKLQVTLSRETHEKLRRAQALLRHSVPTGDAATILDRALTLLIADTERRRLAATETPRVPGSATPGSRLIPAAVKRAVWKRDAGCCAFVGRSGRCGETAFLEFHHLHPHAAGGIATEANIALRCRAHNLYEADLFFGAEFVRESGDGWRGGGSPDDLVPERARPPEQRDSPLEHNGAVAGATLETLVR
jgi:hypothetical protein